MGMDIVFFRYSPIECECDGDCDDCEDVDEDSYYLGSVNLGTGGPWLYYIRTWMRACYRYCKENGIETGAFAAILPKKPRDERGRQVVDTDAMAQAKLPLKEMEVLRIITANWCKGQYKIDNASIKDLAKLLDMVQTHVLTPTPCIPLPIVSLREKYQEIIKEKSKLEDELVAALDDHGKVDIDEFTTYLARSAHFDYKDVRGKMKKHERDLLWLVYSGNEMHEDNEYCVNDERMTELYDLVKEAAKLPCSYAEFW